MQAWLRVAALAGLWGSTFLWIELALEGLSPVQVTFARCALGALVLAVACRARGHRLPRGAGVWRRVAVAALFCNALPFALFSVGQQTVDSGLAGVLNATTPLWSLLLGLAAGTERRLPPARLYGLLLGFAGTVVIFAPWRRAGDAGWGAAAILGAAASYAVAFTYMRRTLTGRGIPVLALSAAQLVAATGLVAAGWAATALPAGGPGTVRPEPGAVAATVVLGVCCTGLTFHLTYRIVADEGATDAAAVGYLLPVVSVALGAVVLGEAVGARVAAGTAVVLAGVALTRRRSAPRPPLPPGGPPDRRAPAARPRTAL